MANIHDIARLAGVSPATVSRAFHAESNINEHTRRQILAIAKQERYRPKQYAARSRSSRKNLTAGVILDCSSYPFANNILRGIGSVMSAEGVMTYYTDSKDDPSQDIVCIDHLKDIVQGLIIVPSTEQNDYNMKFLSEVNRTIPVVTLIRNTSLNNIDSVRTDNFTPTYNAISLLIDHGHEHIAIINGPMIIKPSHDKLSAYTEALLSHNLPIRSEYICYGEFDEEKICGLTKQLLARYPQITALFTSNTTITRGCLKALDELELHIPQDIALISYGNEFCFSLKGLAITAIADPHFVVGQRVAKLLLDRMQNYKYSKSRSPERIVILPELLIRGSEIFPKNRLQERRNHAPL